MLPSAPRRPESGTTRRGSRGCRRRPGRSDCRRPRRCGNRDVYQSRHHSATLPCMSYSPNRFASLLPTSSGTAGRRRRRCRARRLRSVGTVACFSKMSRSPKANGVSVPARAAYSHSASVGSRYAHPLRAHCWPISASVSLRQNSFASSHVTDSTGRCWARCARSASFAGLVPISLRYWPWVTSRRGHEERAADRHLVRRAFLRRGDPARSPANPCGTSRRRASPSASPASW